VSAFRLATEIDPSFADAWSAYAVSLMHSITNPALTGISGEEWLDTVDQALTKALEVDPDNARAHAGRALFYGMHAIDLDRSKMHGDRALELAPNSATTRYARSLSALVRGDYDTARREMRQARLLDPLNIVVERVQAQQSMITGFPDESLVFFEDCLKKRCEGAVWSNYNLMEYAIFTSDWESARQLAAKVDEASRSDSEWSSLDEETWRPLNLALNNELDRVEALLPEYGSADLANLDSFVVVALANNGRFDAALDIMRRGHAVTGWYHYVQSIYLLSDSGYEPSDEFRKYPGYREFYSDPGLAELARERIANGQTAGLPLNEDGSLVEF
jgi:tetratricopeptide (TPR) repeat protein